MTFSITDTTISRADRASRLATSDLFAFYVSDNRVQSGEVNWDFVDADFCILMGDRLPADWDDLFADTVDLYLANIHAGIEIIDILAPVPVA